MVVLAIFVYGRNSIGPWHQMPRYTQKAWPQLQLSGEKVPAGEGRIGEHGSNERGMNTSYMRNAALNSGGP